MPVADPLTTIPEIAKVGVMICQVIELQSNSHKLETLKSAFAKITPLVAEADRLAPFQNSSDWIQIHDEVAEITTIYQKLLNWVGGLNKAQRFVKFWEIRKEIRSLWEYIERASSRIQNANLTSGSKEKELEEKKQHLSMLMKETETGMTASEALQQQAKLLDLKIKFEKALADLVKAANDMKSADDKDLQAYMTQRSFVAMSTVANTNGSTSLADKRKFAKLWLQDCRRREKGSASRVCHKEPGGSFSDIPAGELSSAIGTGEEPSADDISISATLTVDPDFTADVESSSTFKFCTIS